MQPQSEAFDAIVVGSGISGGWAAKELTERGLRVLLLERGKNIEHVKDYSNARKAPWEYPHRGGRTREMVDSLPGPPARLPAEREEPRLVGVGQGFALHRGQAVRLVSRLPRRRTLAHLGPSELPAQRLRLRRQRERRHRRRLADPLRGPGALVRSRRAARGHCRIGRRPAAAARRPVPAGDAAQLRGRDDRRPSGQAVRGTPANHSGPRGEPDPAARRPRPLPVPQRLLARLPVRRVLQHAVVDVAAGDGHRDG